MFKCIGTGTNKCYGEKGEIRYISDNHAVFGVNNGWLEPNIKYIGKGQENPTMLKESIEKAERRIKLEKEKITYWKKIIARAKNEI